MTISSLNSTFAGLTPGIWNIDPAHSEVGFTVRHLMSKVRGSFTTFSGEIQVAPSPLDSAVTATIDLGSVDTRNSDRDAHLRSADFFSVEKESTMTFASTALREHGDDFVATGDLTINGVTHPVELALEFNGVQDDAYGNTRAGFEATTKLSRKEWGISFNVPLDGDKVMIGDTVTVSITIEAVRQA